MSSDFNNRLAVNQKLIAFQIFLMSYVYKSELIQYINEAKETLKDDEYSFSLRDCNTITINETKIFFFDSRYFHTILAESWRQVNENKITSFEELLKKVWNSEYLEENNMSFKAYMDLSFEEFVDLVKKQFFFFKDLKNDEKYRFPLFRLIEENGEITGGFFHFLIKHFEEFSHLHKTSNDQTDFWPNELLFILMSTSIHGEEMEKKEANVENDYKLSKVLKCSYYDREKESQKFQKFKVGLYFDSEVELFSVNTFHRV